MENGVKMAEISNYIGSKKGYYALSVIGLFLLAVIPFREYLDSDAIINATDLLTQDYFWHAFYHDQLRNSPSFMTWNPYINGGASFSGGMHLIFTPISLFSILLFPPNFAITVEALVHLFLAGLFTLLYARLIGLNFLSSFLAATFFMLSTELVSLFNAGHIGKLNTISLFPLVLLTLERALQKRRFFDFVLVSVALSLQFYETHLQISFYSCIVVGIYFILRTLQIYRDEKDLKSLGRIYAYGTIMVLLFLSLSAASISNWLEFKKQSERSGGTTYEFATSWSMPTEELATYVVPQLFGLSRRNYQDPGKIKVFYWGDMPFTQTADYLGLLPLILAVVSLIKRRGRFVLIFLGLTILFQILAMGKYTPIYPFFYEYLGFKFFRVPKMVLFIVSFSVAIMAGYGAQWLLEEFNEGKKRFFKKFILSVIVTAIALASLTLLAEMNQNYLIQYFMPYLRGHGQSYNPSLVLQRYQYAVDGMWLASILLLACAGILALRLAKKIGNNVFFISVLAFFVFDISLLNYKFINAVSMKGNAYFSKDTAVRYFEKDRDIYRVLNAIPNEPATGQKYLTYLVPNKYILYKMHSATGYEAVGLARYNDILDNMSLDGNLVDLLNIKYIVMDKYSAGGTVGDSVGKYDIVLDEDIKILRNKNVLPRVFPVHQARVFQDKDQILMWLSNPNFDPRKAVLLEKPVNIPLSSSPRPETESVVHISSYKNNEIMINAVMADSGFVVLSEKYYPGWKAYLDGKETEIHQADYVLRAVYVPKGEHQLTLRYKPDSYRKGLYITLVTFLFAAAVIIWQGVELYRTRNKE